MGEELSDRKVVHQNIINLGIVRPRNWWSQTVVMPGNTKAPKEIA